MKTRFLALVLALFFAGIAPAKAAPQNHVDPPIQLACEPAVIMGGPIKVMTALSGDRLAVFTRDTLEVVNTAKEMVTIGRLNLSPSVWTFGAAMALQEDFVLVVEQREAGHYSFARLFNVTDPTQPFEEAHFAMPLNYVVQSVVTDTRGWMYVKGNGLIHIYDTTNVFRPYEVATIDYEESFSHLDYDPIRHVLYLMQGSHVAWPIVFDVTDPRSPNRLWDQSGTENRWSYSFKNVEYTVGDWAEGRLYLVAKFQERFSNDPIDMVVRAIDISNPAYLRIVKNTSGNSWEFKIKGPREKWSNWPFPTFHVIGSSLVAYQRSEYLLIDKQSGGSESVRLPDRLNLTGTEEALEDGTVIFDRAARFVRVDFNDPRKPKAQSEMVRIGGKVTAAVTHGGYIFLATQTDTEYQSRLLVLNQEMIVLWEGQIDGAQGMWVRDDLLVMDTDRSSYEFWDITNPTNPTMIQSASAYSASAGLAFANNDSLMVLGDSYLGYLGVVDLKPMMTDPKKWPEQIGRIEIKGLTSIANGEHGVYAAVDGKLFVIDLADPTKPTLIPWGPVEPKSPIVEILGVQKTRLIVRTEVLDDNDRYPTIGELWMLRDTPDRKYASSDYLIMKDEARLPLYLRDAQVMGTFLMLPMKPIGFEDISWELRHDWWEYFEPPYPLRRATCKAPHPHSRAVLSGNTLVELNDDGFRTYTINHPGVKATIYLPMTYKVGVWR